MPEDVSEDMEAYFQNLKERSRNAHDIAQEAREQGYDPEGNVEIQLAENLAERVVGLISAEAPQIVDSGAMKRIMELEEEYAPLDWRVPLKIAYEVAEEKFCEFEDKHRAMEIGIRTGFAYQTAGIVSAPLEGFTDLEIKKRRDGEGEYFCLHYAGPVRAAGGTAASVSVLIADYVRKKMGYEKYDPTDKEVKRCPAELEDYHEYVTNLQYYPSKEESTFLVENLPVEISGDASEKYELSNANLKDLDRIPANRLRSGYCLIHSSCIPLKAKKMWKRLDKWGDEMDMEQWNFLEEFLEIQKKARSGDDSDEDEEKDTKIKPNYTYIKDLVGGRPVFGHPMEEGGLRLRYGRGRNTGFNSQAVHPATMRISNEFLAVGTQLKTERPGKAASYNSVDTVDGPIVKLENGDVYELDSDEKAKKVEKDIEEILYFGDVLVSYGDFVEQAHELVPPGYCEEIWIKQLEKNADIEEIDDLIGEQKRKDLFENPLTHDIRYDEAKALSDSFDIPLHPKYTYFYKALDKEKLETLRNSLANAKDVNENVCIIKDKECKRSLELIGLPHKVKKGKIIVKKDKLDAVRDTLQIGNDYTYDKDVLETINKHSPYHIEDKAGTFIGTRMGRPEKAKMRELKGSPHVLFPVGEEGGRLRSFQSAMDEGHITANMQMFECPECERETPFKVCEKCESRTKELRFNRDGERDDEGDLKYKRNKLRIAEAMRDMRNRHSIRLIPDLVKGVRGTSNKQHKSEYLAKGILRSKHGITVNKDGTVRYDCSELALTHFKPKEISTSIQRLKELGYEKDIHGEELEDEDQILELKIQDIVLPSCDDAVDEPADTVIENTANFVDEELEKIYDMDPYYDVKDKDDLAGILAVGLAPHTSAGTLTRIIGFSNTQGFYGHPYIHAAMRRDCDGDESCIALLMDAFLNFSREYLPQQRGSTMDAPLVLTSRVISTEVDDQIFDLDVVDEYPLEMYEAAKEYKMPWEVDIETIEDRIGNPNQYEDIGFTHDTSDINGGVVCSSYKTLPSMGEKVEEQMDVAVKLRSVDQTDVAKLVIDRHFLRDTKGNLKKFSMQQFRCVQCNTKYRRPPLNGKCNECDGKIIFTISEGSITKYMDYSLMLADKYDIDTYTRQVLDLTKVRIEGVFGKEKEKQTGLDTFMSS